jgi:hypothetical protein
LLWKNYVFPGLGEALRMGRICFDKAELPVIVLIVTKTNSISIKPIFVKVFTSYDA